MDTNDSKVNKSFFRRIVRILKLFRHFKNNILSGLFAIIPLALVIFIIHIFYLLIDRKIMWFIEKQTGIKTPIVGVLILFASLYFVGLFTKTFFLKKIFTWIEYLSKQIPIVNSIYQVGKQLSSTFSKQNKKIFKRVVHVPVNENLWTIGFVSGFVKEESTQERFLKVFVPTSPNPTSGFIFFMKENDIKNTNWTTEQATKTFISGGILSPEYINLNFNEL